MDHIPPGVIGIQPPLQILPELSVSRRQSFVNGCCLRHFLSPYPGLGPGARLGWRSNSQTLQRGRIRPCNRGNPPPNNETQQPKSGSLSGTNGARDVSAIACRARSASEYPSFPLSPQFLVL